MHAIGIIQRCLCPLLKHVHARRLTTLLEAVLSCVGGPALSLTDVGRRFAGEALLRHKIKRADRLLGNRQLQQEARSIYAALCRVTVARIGEPVILIDSWFANNDLFKPLRTRLGECAHPLSRLRVSSALYAIAEPSAGRAGRPRKYGQRTGSAAQLAEAMRAQANTYTLHVYGARREVVAAERIVMLKTLRCRVRVVWVYRKRQWVALMSTDLDLSIEQIVEYYAARWKIEAGFREIKKEMGAALL